MIKLWNLRCGAITPLAILLAAACSGASDGGGQVTGRWQGTRKQAGDTLTVRTTSGSVWGGNGELVEEAAIGTETRGDDDLLGRVAGIDATADRIFIADYVLVTVRVYDMAGNHVMDIGRVGEGPGEFGVIVGLAVDRTRGELVVRQINAVLHRFSLSGEYRSSQILRLSGGLSGGSQPLLRVTPDGTTLIQHFFLGRTPQGGLRLVRALLTVDSTGALTDTLDLPRRQDDPYVLKAFSSKDSYRPEAIPFAPHEIWNVTWDGAFITGNSSTYRFGIRYRDGRTTVIERDVEPVPVIRGEKSAAQKRVYGILRDFQPGWRWDGPDIPGTKAFYDGITSDRSGRLWVLREGKGRRVQGWTEPEGWKGWEANPEWVSERWWDVFEEATGRYLGRVDVPPGFVNEPEPYIDGDTFICLTEDDVGRPVVRRYRLVVPG